MASYKTHDRVTIYSAALLAPLSFWAAKTYSPTLWGYPLTTTPFATTVLVVGAYLFSGLWLSNDLDINSRIYRRWGPLRWLWYPYQKLVSHRSWLSHGFAIGPLGRLVYLCGMIELTLFVMQQLIRRVSDSADVIEAGWSLTAQVWPYVIAHPHISAPMAVGLVLGGLSHSLVDFA
jgi:uncharacterized metal-binding protein